MRCAFSCELFLLLLLLLFHVRSFPRESSEASCARPEAMLVRGFANQDLPSDGLSFDARGAVDGRAVEVHAFGHLVALHLGLAREHADTDPEAAEERLDRLARAGPRRHRNGGISLQHSVTPGRDLG